MNQISQRTEHFPRALSGRPFGELDRTFLFLFLLFGMIAFPTIWRLKEIPVPEVSRQEREQYLRVIYRTAPPTSQVIRSLEETAAEGAGEEIRGVETAPGRETVRQRAERRAEQAQAAQARRQQRLAAARSTGIFTAAGAQMPSFREFTGSGALALSGGSLAGIRAGEMEQIVSSPSAEAIAKLRREGLIGSEELETENLLADQLEEVELAMETSEVALDALPTVRGRASADRARDAGVLRSVIRVELEGLRACYRVQKRKDASLRGSLEVRLVILPAGEVTRVRLRNSIWSNPALGVRVERCLEDRIGRWIFDPASGGEVSLEFPLVFR